jgi:hypothetical protein
MYHILHTNKTTQADIKLPFVARFRYIVAAMVRVGRMETVAVRLHDVRGACSGLICLLDINGLSE